MRTFFLFYLLSYLLGNPLLALVVVGLIFYFGEARYRGRYFNPAKFASKRRTITELQQRLSINEHDAEAHNDVGRLLVDASRANEAMPHLERAIARMPDSAETNYYYGLCLLDAGRVEEGRKHVERCLEINPRFRYGDPHLALARSELAGGRAAQAAEKAALATRLNTSSIEGWVLLGQAKETAAETTSARAAYDSAVEAYGHLPRYLRLPNRRWLRAAKKARRSVQPRS